MPLQRKISWKFATCLAISCCFFITAFAQQVKKATPLQKKPVTLTKKTPVAKPVAKKIPVKTKPVKKVPVIKKEPAKPVTIADLKMTSRENQMVDEINLVRSDPAGYVKYVKEYIKKNKTGKQIKTAANELIAELQHLKPLNTLKVSPDLYLAARDYGKTMIENNSIEHSDLPYAENLSFGIENIRDAIIDLLIDDDVEGRGHRKNILRKNITMIGVVELQGKVEDFLYCYIQEFK